MKYVASIESILRKETITDNNKKRNIKTTYIPNFKTIEPLKIGIQTEPNGIDVRNCNETRNCVLSKTKKNKMKNLESREHESIFHNTADIL